MEIQTPAPILMNFCTHIPTCPRKVLVQGLGGPKIPKAEENIFENCLLYKRCLAGCKLIRAGPGTSASI